MNVNRAVITVSIIFLLLLSCTTVAQQQPAPLENASSLKTDKPEPSQLSPERKDELEDWAGNAPGELKQSLTALAGYLDQPCQNDIERAWTIFVWVSENIAYDTDAFFYGKTKPQTGSSVLQSGMAVCAGYSDIYKSLADIIGLETVSISGHGKGYSYSPGSAIQTNHAWTAVMIDGEWVLIDSTWGAGYVGDDKKFHKKFDPYWFNVDPEIMIFTHLPENPAFQLTGKQWSKAEYSALPQLRASAFASGLTPESAHAIHEHFPERLDDAAEQFEKLGELGFSIEQISSELFKPEFRGFVKTYMPPANRKLTAVNLPAGAVLEQGEGYTFEYKIENCIRYAIIYNGEWHFALREGEDKYSFSGFYDGTIDKNGLISFKLDCSAPGSIKIVAQPEEGDSFGSFLEYRVE